ncbi:MAG TPA: M28 family peptidase, partial [Terricaulis sp.]|nr:M28 family peptidase [Terricaulis sp.]
MRSHWAWLGGVALLIVALLIGLRSVEHAPTGTRFDSASAYATLTRINPENRAHPIGSAHNRLIRTRIETELRALGYAPEIQSDLICTDFAPGCSFVENIVAVKDGAGEDIILVTAHYDSAPIAPGAGDDLAGIAVMLEIARRIAETPTQNDIVFLFADGEEAGLRGAMAFARKHPLMERVELVLNMEARGVSGPSAMFETSAGAAPLIQAFAQSAPHPVANSLFYEVYRRMPNNTDLTIYKGAGAMAMNFAFSRGVALYHSARDNNAHLSQASMAHHG